MEVIEECGFVKRMRSSLGYGVDIEFVGFVIVSPSHGFVAQTTETTLHRFVSYTAALEDAFVYDSHDTARNEAAEIDQYALVACLFDENDKLVIGTEGQAKQMEEMKREQLYRATTE